MTTRLLFVRHGETSYNATGRIQGRLDIPLNERGFEQAAAVGAALADVSIGELYSSSLSRARETAVGIAKQHAHLTAPGAPFWIDDRLQERGFGSLEGIVYGVPGVRKRDSIDGIEQMSDFNERLASALTDILSGPAPWSASGSAAESVSGYLDSTTQLHPPQGSSSNGHKAAGTDETRTIVIVGHGASISALLGEVLLDAGYAALAPGVQRSRVWNCSITELELSAEGLQKLKSAAGTAHSGTDTLQAGHRERRQSWLIRPPHVLQQQNAKDEGVVPEELKGVFVVRRWADVSHIGPAQANTLVKNADEELEKQTRKD